MTFLLDTSYMLWTLTDTGKLSKTVKKAITDPRHRIVISTVSFWEVSLKSSVDKLNTIGFSPSDLPEACLKAGFDIESLSAEISSTYYKLNAPYHKDPFDRMLIWQAIRSRYTLISTDSNVKKYATEGLMVFRDE